MQIMVDMLIPLMIILMMLVVGLELTFSDFRRVKQYPVVVLVGIVGQILLLPAIAIVIAWVLKPSPFIIAGMILVAACPGGAISNYYVYMARANVALSVTLTAASTVMGFITLPLLVSAGFWLLLRKGEHIDVPVTLMISQLFLLLLLPVAAGMWIRHLWPQWVAKRVKLLRWFSILALGLIILFVIWNQAGNLLPHLKELMLSVSIYTLLAMLAGWGASVGLKANSGDRFALMVEYSVRNMGIVTVVGATLLNNMAMLVFAAAFFLIQIPLLLIAVYVQRRY